MLGFRLRGEGSILTPNETEPFASSESGQAKMVFCLAIVLAATPLVIRALMFDADQEYCRLRFVSNDKRCLLACSGLNLLILLLDIQSHEPSLDGALKVVPELDSFPNEMRRNIQLVILSFHSMLS